MKHLLPASLVLIGLLGGCTKSSPPGTPVPAMTVSTVMATDGEIAREIAFSGTWTPRFRINITSESGSGRVEAILVEASQTVQAGDVLLRLDRRDAQVRLDQVTADVRRSAAQIEQARAQLVEAVAALNEAERVRARSDILAKAGNVSPELAESRTSAVEQAAARRQASESAITAAEAELAHQRGLEAEVRLALTRTEVRAPCAGVILRRTVDPGDYPVAGTTMLTMVQDGESELTAQIPERFLPGIAANQPAQIRLDAQELHGTVRIIEPEIDPRTRLGTVRISLPQAVNRSQVGGSCLGMLRTGSARGLKVPLSAVRRSSGGGASTMIAVVVDGTVRLRPVVLGVADGHQVIVTDGLAEGDEVVTGASARVEVGMRVATAPVKA